MKNMRYMDARAAVEYLCSLAEVSPAVWAFIALTVARDIGRLPDAMHNRMLMEPGMCGFKKEYLEIIGGSDGVG